MAITPVTVVGRIQALEDKQGSGTSVPELNDLLVGDGDGQTSWKPSASIIGHPPLSRFDPRDYGALVNGNFDGTGDNDYAALLACVVDAKAEIASGNIYNAEIYLPPGVMNVAPTLSSNKITLGSHLHIRQAPDGYIDLSKNIPGGAGGTPRDIFYASGTEDARQPLTGNTTRGSFTISVDSGFAATLVEGQCVHIGSDAIFDPGQTDEPVGEFNYVRRVSGSTVDLWNPLEDAYTTADDAFINIVNLLEDISFVGLKFKGDLLGDYNTAGVGAQPINLYKVMMPYIHDIDMERTNYKGIFLADCPSFLVTDIRGRDFFYSSQQYLVAAADNCHDGIFSGIQADHVRHAMSTNNTHINALPRRIIFNNFAVRNTIPVTTLPDGGGDAVDTHGAAQDIWFTNGSVIGSTGSGINHECCSGGVRNVSITGCGWRPDGNANGIYAHNESSRKGYFIAENVYIRNCEGYGLVVSPEGAGGYSIVELSNVNIEDCAGPKALIGHSGGPIDRLIITGGSSHGTGTFKIWNANAFSWTGGVHETTVVSDDAVSIQDAKNGTVVGVTAILPASSTASGFSVESGTAGASDDINFTANRVKSPTPSSSKGLRLVNNARNIKADRSNDFEQCTTPITPGTGTGHELYTRRVQSLTIATGAITIGDWNTALVLVDTEAAAATDDLDTINSGQNGQIITVSSTVNSRDVVLKDNTGNLKLAGDFTCLTTLDTIQLIFNSATATWNEIGRSTN